MAYSIAILDQCDFEGISRQMPSGTGVDASLADGTTASKKRKKRGKYKKWDNNKNNSSTTNNIALVIENIGNSEARVSSLHILIEYGALEEKWQALAEIRNLVYKETATMSTVTNMEVAAEAASLEIVDTESASAEEAEEGSSKASETSNGTLCGNHAGFSKGYWLNFNVH